MTWLILGASAAILVLAFFLRRHARNRLAALGLAGEVIYSDYGGVDEVLVSHRHGLTGKPDYIRREGEELIPVGNPAPSRQQAPTRAKSSNSRPTACWWKSDLENRCSVASSCIKTGRWKSPSMTNSAADSAMRWPN
jgi:hypothetical protein